MVAGAGGGVAVPSAGDNVSKRPELEAVLRALPWGIGKTIRVLRAAPDLELIARDVLDYRDELPEEIIERAKAAVDVLDGGDGRIYR